MLQKLSKEILGNESMVSRSKHGMAIMRSEYDHSN